MRKLRILMLMLGIITLGMVVSCNLKTEKVPAINLADLDTSVDPAEDFDNYANGGWKKNNPMPEDKSRYGTFDKLREEAQNQLNTLIQGIREGKHEEGSISKKIADFYNLGMDTALIEKQGLAPLKPYFEMVDKLETIEQVQQLIAFLHNNGSNPAFGSGVGADAKNSDMNVMYIGQSGLGMPDRDYYTGDDPRSVKLRELYVDHVQKMFGFLGNTPEEANANTNTIMEIETRLAHASMTRLERRDPHKTYNKSNLEELSKLAPDYNWSAYFDGIGVGDPGKIIVGQPLFFKELSKMMAEVSVEDWKVYLHWNILNTAAAYLNKEIDAQNFEFYGKALSGQEKQEPRWKRVLDLTSGVMGEAIGQVYVAKYFPPEAKERMVKLVSNLKESLGNRIDNLEWMSGETKQKAHEKLATIKLKIGYPDKWRSYDDLEVKSDAYILNLMRAAKFGREYNLSKLNKPVDKEEWGMTPQTVNAYYSPVNNEIAFPAAILQPPFFFLDGDDAVNYGAIGVVIGHEMTHGFDDKGRLFDKEGNMKEWWTKEDAEKFEKRSEVLVNQFDQFVVLGDVHADGKLSLGENIADLGGLNISYDAFMKANTVTEKIDGFTPEQRFFLAYAHVWGQNIRDKEMLRRTKEDVHSLGRFRVIGPLRNVPQFHDAFNVKEGSYMYLPEEERASIW